MKPQLRLKLFGTPQFIYQDASLTGFRTNKARALLIYLAVTACPHSRDTLANLLWADNPSSSRNNLKKILSNLRNMDGVTLLEEGSRTVALDPSSYWLDVHAFSDLAKKDSLDDVAEIDRTVALYQADFLTGFNTSLSIEFEEWVLATQSELKTQLLDLLHRLANKYMEQKLHPKAITVLRQLLKIEPWQEESHRRLIVLHAENGDVGAALAQYEICCENLRAELDVEPSSTTVELVEKVRNGEFTASANELSIVVASSASTTDSFQADLLEMPDMGIVCGREEELAQLAQWIVVDGCRLCAVLGVGGVGKTSLAAKFTNSLLDLESPQDVSTPFKKIFWRSLLNAPPLDDILHQCIVFFSDQQILELPPSLDEQLRLLTQLLQKQRGLLILDNAESIMQGGQKAGSYRSSYEDYGQFIQRIAQSDHQSCLLLTSRESPQELAQLERDIPKIRSLQVHGLSDEAASQILVQQGLASITTQRTELIKRYSGHPLALKLVAEIIDEFYFGDVNAFLADDTLIFADIHDVLTQQFARLSPLELEIMTWLAIEREPVSLQKLRDNLLGSVNQRDFLGALQGLQRRSLLEKQYDGFALQNVIIEYVTDRFIKQICEELDNDCLETFNRYALLKADAKEYVRESQRRLILRPVVENLQEQFRQESINYKFTEYLDYLRFNQSRGYAGGNILNVLLYIKSVLSDFDFSSLAVCQVNLQNEHLPDVNFSHADLSGWTFTDTFDLVGPVAFHSEGIYVAAGTAGGEILIWQTPNGKLVRILKGHFGGVRAIAFSPRNNIIASGSVDQTVRLWDLDTGTTLRVLSGHSGRVRSVCFDATGTILASGGDDQIIFLWNVDSGQHHMAPIAHTTRIRSICFSPHGRTFASAGIDQSIYIWEVATGQVCQVIRGHAGEVNSLEFSPDGQLLASGSTDQTIRLWCGKKGTCLSILQGHTGSVNSVCFDPQGRTLASASEDETVRLWDIETESMLRTLQGHAGWVWSASISPQGDIIASGGVDRTVRFWDLSSGKALYTISGYTNGIRTLDFSPNSTLLISGGKDETVRIWDIDKAQQTHLLGGHTGWINSVLFTPDGSMVISSGEDQKIYLWDVETQKLLDILEGHNSWIGASCIHPKGSVLSTGDASGIINQWDLFSKEAKRLKGHKAAVNVLCYNSAGTIMASGGDDFMIRLWDITRGQTIEIMQGHAKPIWAAAFHPNGQILASGGDDCEIRIWPVSDLRHSTYDKNSNSYPVRKSAPSIVLYGHSGSIRSLAFSPDGRFLTSGGDDYDIIIWNVQNGEIVDRLRGHASAVSSLVFGTQKKLLASSDVDGEIRLWDIYGSRCLKTMRPDRPYERMNITGVTGITETQKATLKALGAVEFDQEHPSDISHEDQAIELQPDNPFLPSLKD